MTTNLFEIVLWVAITYGTAAAAYSYIARYRARRAVARGAGVPELGEAACAARAGSSFIQMSSFIVSLLTLLALLLAAGPFLVLQILLPSVGVTAFANGSNDSLFYGALGLLVLAPIQVIVNGIWTFNNRLTRLEAEGIANGEGRKVRVQRAVAWIVWMGGIAVSFWLLNYFIVR